MRVDYSITYRDIQLPCTDMGVARNMWQMTTTWGTHHGLMH